MTPKFSNVCSLYNKQEKKLKFDKSSIVLHVIYSATKLYAKGWEVVHLAFPPHIFPSKLSLEHVTSRVKWGKFRIKYNKSNPNLTLAFLSWFLRGCHFYGLFTADIFYMSRKCQLYYMMITSDLKFTFIILKCNNYSKHFKDPRTDI